MIPQKLRDIAANLKNGVAAPRMTVAQLVCLFNYERRGWNVISEIRDALAQCGIVTAPDFNAVGYYDQIGFTLSTAAAEQGVDPTLRISRLEHAKKSVKSFNPQDPLTKIIPEMVMHEYSQVVVMTGERDLKGVVTWESIALAGAFGKPSAIAQDVMVTPFEVSLDTPLTEAIPIVARSGYVLIRDSERKISGIVTSSDLNDILSHLSGAFLSLGEIEGYLRLIVGRRFSLEELRAVCTQEDRPISGPHDLTLGELIRLIENPEHWKKLHLLLDRVDRVEFVGYLNRARDIRNDVMHFDPDGIAPEEQTHLEKLVTLLREILVT